MISDSIPNASVAMASPNPKDFAKKKRANRSAKLKQCKLDARREQWLSLVKNKGGTKEDVSGGGVTKGGPSLHLEKKDRQLEKLQIKPRSEEEIFGNGSTMHHYSYSEFSPSNSPTSHTSSVLGSNDSGVNFSASSRSSSSSGRSSSSCSNCFCSGNMSEEGEGEDGDDGCLDDWEAVADALVAPDNKQKEYNPNSGFGSPSSEKHEYTTQSGSQLEAANHPLSGISNQESQGTDKQQCPVNRCAWRPDDAYRPQSLPDLSRQYSLPLKSERERHFGPEESVWSRKILGPIPTSCPICFEDLDNTDSSFLPCLCGFRLCLFCHKRILEEDGRCPGCRKQYQYDPVEGEATLDGGTLTIHLARSCSMITRS